MRYHFVILLIIGIMLTACKEVFVGQTPVDGTAPKQIINPQVINVEGGAFIIYELPDEEDLLYVEAQYQRNSGEIAIAQASVYTDTLKIEGLGDTALRTVRIRTIDRSFNYSEPLQVTVKPLIPPLHIAHHSFQAEQVVGGIDLTWENPKEVNLIIEVLRQEESGDYISIDMIYSNVARGKYAIRNQVAKMTDYAFYMRDRWGNEIDTIFKTLTPLYEEKMHLTHYPMVTTTPVIYNWVHDNLFDDNVNTCNHTSESQLPIPHQFTFKSDIPVKVRHIRAFHRDGWEFGYATPLEFEIWATNSTPNADGSDEGWVLLGTFTSVKPSGLPIGETSAEDKVVARKTGEEFTVKNDGEYQYFRYKLLDSYDGQPRMCFAELQIYGEPHGYLPGDNEEESGEQGE